MDLNSLTIGLDCTVKTALKMLDRGGERTLFVVDEDFLLLGIITDSDIRRYLIKDGDLQKTIEGVCNRKPTVISESTSTEQAKALMLKLKREIIPIVDDDGKLKSYITWDHVFGEKSMSKASLNVPVVIMSGGKGTRLDPFTRILPKPLIPVGNKPMLEWIMDKFGEHGISDFYLTINYKGEMIRSYFDYANHDYNMNYIQEDSFLGTAGSLKLLPAGIIELCACIQ